MTKHVYCIAEIGINHNGDMSIAKELINISADAGCDAVKFQKRTINEVYSEEELAKPRESPWGTTTRQQKEGLELSIEQYEFLEEYAYNRGLDFIVSCWDLTSVKEIEENLNVRYHKIASALLTHKDLLDAIAKTNKNVIMSTGMSSTDEIDKAINILGPSLTHVLACTSTYPSKPEEINLKYIATLKEQYPSLSIGFSNHYSGMVACFGAVALGADALEFHITKDRTMYGSDQSASIENVKGLIEGVRHLEKMIGDGEKIVYESEVPIAKKLRRYTTT